MKMNIYPAKEIKKKEYPLQSLLFGHRIQPSQTKYEYLIEFLQVAIAEKRGGDKPKENPSFTSSEMFPIGQAADGNLSYVPKLRIGLKRFVFFPKSKLEGKANVDKDAYEECVKNIGKHITGGSSVKKKNSVMIIQKLLSGFNTVNQNRSWFDQNMLPVCPEVILPEGMGVKSKRKDMIFDLNDAKIDGEFDYHKYTYMCRGGEVYYLHLLHALSKYPEYKETLETRLQEMITSFPQFSYLCKFVQSTWEDVYVGSKDVKKEVKTLGIIPTAFAQRDQYTLSELNNFLSSKSHPFEKMETLANGMLLQMMRMMYLAAATEHESNCWMIDVNCAEYKNVEAKKCAITAFKHNEEVISMYLYEGLNQYREFLDDQDDLKLIKAAADDSYRLFRKLGKTIGIIIPAKGPGMRFSLSEEIIKFLVLSIIPPKQMITLDEFVDQLYLHFGMVIGTKQYKQEVSKGSLKDVGDCSFLDTNVQAFGQKLKDCGFLRDLSDATSIVENPYELEEQIK